MLLQVRNLEKSYGYGARRRPVVRGVSFDVDEGEVVGLLGKNGAGKTTSFRMTIGFIEPDGGTVTFCGKDVTRWPMFQRARAGMGYQPQEHSMFRDLTVEDNLTCILETLGLSRTERRTRRDRLIADYGLEKVRKSYAKSLSGGEKRRLEIARALITEPKLMLLDEPFAGVDPIARADIRAIVDSLKSRRISVLMTDHDAESTLKTVSRVYVMDDGQVLVSGTPQEIVANEAARSTYLGKDFKLDLPVARHAGWAGPVQAEEVA